MSTPDLQALLPVLIRFKSAGDIIMRGLTHRGELALVELKTARSDVATMAVIATVGGGALFLAGFGVNLLVAAIYWDTPHRITAMACVVGIELFLALAAGVWISRWWKKWQPWATTQIELHQDLQCLQQIFQKPAA